MGSAAVATSAGADLDGARASWAPRVGMLTALFPPSIGGIQSHTLLLARKLAERGSEVHVVTRLEPGLARFERVQGVRVHRVGLGRARGAAASAAFTAEAVRAVLRLAPQLDVLHAHQLLSPSTAGVVASRLTGLPLVVNPHACGAIGDVGLLSASGLGRARLRAIVGTARAHVAVSQAIAGELVGAGAAPGAVWNVPNGVDVERFAPAAEGERRLLRAVLRVPAGPLVVYSGRLAPEKGVDLLVRAWPAVLARVPGARLAVVGDGPEAARLRADAAPLGDAITFTGGVADTAPWLRAADAAVLPSRTEGMPVALLEAMSCGLPVVATRVGGSAEVLGGERCGWLAPPEDPAALAAALVEALLGGERSARRGAAARALVQERYGIDAVADRFLELYRAVATPPAAQHRR